MSLARIITVNVGNSNVSVGAFEGSTLVQTWRISTEIGRTPDELGMTLRWLLTDADFSVQSLDGVAISSVVPPLGRTFVETSRRYLNCDPLMVGPGIKTGLPIRCDNPKDVGSDRIVNAVAAIHFFGSPLIVVKLGTATTLCVVNDEGVYVGGIIAPGIQSAADALFERTAKLPRIELAYPGQVIGKNTIASMQSGILYGSVGMVDGLVARIFDEYPLPFKVIATGGLAELVSEQSQTIHHTVPHLTLEGLRLLWHRNRLLG